MNGIQLFEEATDELVFEMNCIDNESEHLLDPLELLMRKEEECTQY